MSDRYKMWLVFGIAAAIMAFLFFAVLTAQACEEGSTAVELSTFTARAATQEPVKDDCRMEELLWVIPLYGIGCMFFGVFLGRRR